MSILQVDWIKTIEIRGITMLVDLNVKEFVKTTASNEPVPGGGSIAALSGALGVALAEMVANLTVGKKKYEDVEEEMKELVVKAQAIQEKLVALIDKDAVSFDDVMKAFKMPKETEEEKAARTEEIQKGMKHAASVPFETAKTAFEIMDIAELAVEKGNTNAVTDGAIAAMMGRNAVLGAILNVRINLGSIKDADFVSDMTKKCDDLEEKVQSREKEILAKVSL